MSGPRPSSPHTDESDVPAGHLRHGRLLLLAIGLVVVVAVAVVYFSAKTWSAAGDSQSGLPQHGDPIDGRTSMSVTSLPPLTTMTAVSQEPTPIGGESASSSVSSSPSPSSSAPPVTTRSSAPPPAAKSVEYQVVSDAAAVIQYRAANGQAWDYSMEAGRWKIIAPGGGSIEARTKSGSGSVRCVTRQVSPSKVLAEDRSRSGSVICAA